MQARPDNPASTYAIAAEQIGSFVQPLWPGALAMPFSIRDEDGRRLGLADDHLSGKSLFLLILNDASAATAGPALTAFSACRDKLSQYNSTVVAISSTSDAVHNRALKQSSGFNWPVAGDSTGAVFASYGLHKDNDTAFRIVLLTPLRQVRVWFDTPDDLNETVSEIMDLLKNTQVAEEARWAPPHAPILMVPNVLSREECGQLIQSFEKGGPLMVRPPAGTAMVFSSSLLHEVQETTKGTRYNLISHFFNEAALPGG